MEIRIIEVLLYIYIYIYIYIHTYMYIYIHVCVCVCVCVYVCVCLKNYAWEDESKNQCYINRELVCICSAILQYSTIRCEKRIVNNETRLCIQVNSAYLLKHLLRISSRIVSPEMTKLTDG